jgi:hypothetical protein
MPSLTAVLIEREPMCHYCGDPATTADHIVPRSAGGPAAWWNLVPACFPCNSAKGDTWPNHFDCDRCREAERRFISGQIQEPEFLRAYGSRKYWRSVAKKGLLA